MRVPVGLEGLAPVKKRSRDGEKKLSYVYLQNGECAKDARHG